MNAIRAAGVRKAFGSITALAGVDLDVRAGEFYGLLGPNGAGKTTLLRILTGLLKPDAGRLEILGEAVQPHRTCRHLGIVPQDIALYDALSARANLQIFGAVAGLRGEALSQRMDAALAAVGLTDRAGSRVKTFSGGMKRRLNLAVGLLTDPPILLLDEPTVGVDPQSRASIFALLQTLHGTGKTIIYTTHYIEEAERLCQRIGIIDHGCLLAEGTPAALMERVTTPRRLRVFGAAVLANPPLLAQTEMLAAMDYVDYIPRQPALLGRAVSDIERTGIAYDRLEIVGPNLETLFLQLTGRELRD